MDKKTGEEGIFYIGDFGTTIIGVDRGFATALALARASDLIATVPKRHTGILRRGMYSFALPISTPEFTVSLLWNPRLDANLAHRWLRGCVREVCAEQLANSPAPGNRPKPK